MVFSRLELQSGVSFAQGLRRSKDNTDNLQLAMAEVTHADVKAVEDFLTCNGVNNGWKNLIVESAEVCDSLKNIIEKMKWQGNNAKWPYVPRADQVLRAFSLCKPENIKFIIIGIAPTTQRDLENGLSYSANRTESACYGDKGNEIILFHKALKRARILEEGCNYYCGHEDWAENGALLLNVALTTHVDDIKLDPNLTRFRDCKLWSPFLVNLLKRWILETQLENMIFVMPWDYESGGYTKRLWEAIIDAVNEEVQKEQETNRKEMLSTKIDSYIRVIKTFRASQNGNYFVDLVAYGNMACKVFQTKTKYPYDDVVQFLIDNSVKEEWQNLILGSSEMKNTLQGIICDIHQVQGLWDPPAHKILRAFAYCEPNDIKVIIIGTSPVTCSETPTGLSFSCNKMDSQCCTAISNVTEVLRYAGILKQNFSYYCGHEEWAKSGVLLLNAALTIPHKDDSEENIKEHSDKWRPFLAELLNTWIEKFKPHNIFIMSWCDVVKCRTVGMELWRKLSTQAQAYFTTLKTSLPTFSPSGSKFIAATTKEFSHENFPSNAFATNTVYPHYDLEQFLKENGVKNGWKKLIMASIGIKITLQGIINDRDHIEGKWVPATNQILRAFAYCEPVHIKVVIIGTSPGTGYGVANGLSFSANRMESACFGDNGRDICKVHDALRKAEKLDQAKMLQEGKDYYCGHEEWARNGVLLLNAALTIDADLGEDPEETIKAHCRMWRPFLAGLLSTWMRKTKRKIFVMIWGHEVVDGDVVKVPNYAKELWKEISNVPGNFHVMEAHHPTFPLDGNTFIESATKHFSEIASHSDGDNEDIFDIL